MDSRLATFLHQPTNQLRAGSMRASSSTQSMQRVRIVTYIHTYAHTHTNSKHHTVVSQTKNSASIIVTCFMSIASHLKAGTRPSCRELTSSQRLLQLCIVSPRLLRQRPCQLCQRRPRYRILLGLLAAGLSGCIPRRDALADGR